MRPLEGITVVSLEHAIAAPFATRQLADLGARVIKVERPGAGDFARAYDERVNGLASHFVWTNRSKESIALDLKSEDGVEALRRLIAKADVLVQNLAPGATARMGFDGPTLAERYPQLIVCEISGFGQDGPDRDRKAYDLLIQAESGFLSVTGTPGDVVKAGCSIADIAAGMYAYTNILAGLIERGRTGKGRHIDVSMLEAMAEWMSFPLYYAFDGAPQPPRSGAAHATIYPYGPFDTADGVVLFGIQNEREWASFCEKVLRLPTVATNPLFATNSARSANRAALAETIAAVLGKQPTAEVIEALDSAKIANAPVNDMAGLWSHRQLKARRRWREVGTQAGAVPALLPPGQADARMDPVPAPGEHTAKILAEIGMSVEADA
ncbi:CaiB/BaiF CoA transferase family protein [Sphingomonas jeddahensis]|uniref:Formyl-coenzyme A transferase n=1 Tax=Sphingomonas jeddahensis TaxID=1915074 RepID=A0A1V2EXC8_9SPHN|nr:CaiB/BaiF CoA-transferase family protein [Sphingomonas jeddahensis]ONF96849.1 Formyl-coenzyme A transferase [Sphingomonas jeddahensis]